MFGLLILGLEKGRSGAVVRAVSLSHQVAGSKQPLRRFAGEGLPRFFSSPDPTHVGASGTRSALFFITYIRLRIIMKGGPGGSGRVLPPVTGRSRVRVAVFSHCTGEGKACH